MGNDNGSEQGSRVKEVRSVWLLDVYVQGRATVFIFFIFYYIY